MAVDRAQGSNSFGSSRIVLVASLVGLALAAIGVTVGGGGIDVGGRGVAVDDGAQSRRGDSP